MPLNAKETRKCYFGEKAKLYDLKNADTEKRKREELILERFLSGSRGTLIDCPVGTGHFLPLYNKLGFDVIGFDVSDQMMNVAKAKGGARIIWGDIFNPPLDHKFGDVVVCMRFLTLIETKEMELALVHLADLAKEKVICSIKLADKKRVQNRSVTHSMYEFEKAVAVAGMKISLINTIVFPSYKMVQLQCA